MMPKTGGGMLWLFVGVGFLFAIVGAMSGGKKTAKPKPSVSLSPSRSQVGIARLASGRPAYAAIEERGNYRSLTSEDVTALLSPFRDQLRKHRSAATKARKAADS
jgi:hypothetical protein